MKVEPQEEHRWLHRMLGEWTSEGEAPTEPGKPPVKWTSIETVRSLGGLWVVAENRSDMSEGEARTSLMTLGFDPAKQRYVGTFVGSMMTNLWVYEGALDGSGFALTLDTEGPNMADPSTMAKYKDVIEFKSDDLRTLTSHVQAADGTWSEFMSMTYQRRK